MKAFKSLFSLIVKICIAIVALYFGAYYFFFGDWQGYFYRSKYSSDIISSINHSNNYKRDSLFTIKTINGFIDSNYNIFDYYNRWNVPLNKVTFWVDTIIYSPDSLKMISFVIFKNPNIENRRPSDYFYSGSDMIAYRDSKKELWKLFYWGTYRPTGYDGYEMVKNAFYKHYFNDGKFKKSSRYYWDSISNNFVSISNQYSINDVKFWDSSIIWQKGSSIPNYYSFETTGNVKPTDENPIKKLPFVDYPDSLIALFKQ